MHGWRQEEAKGMQKWGREFNSGLRLVSNSNPRSQLVPLRPTENARLTSFTLSLTIAVAAFCLLLTKPLFLSLFMSVPDNRFVSCCILVNIGPSFHR